MLGIGDCQKVVLPLSMGFKIKFYTNLLKRCSFNESKSTWDNAGSKEALMPSRGKELKMIWHRHQLSAKASFLLPWWRFIQLYRDKPHLPLSGAAESTPASDRSLAFEALHCSATHRNNLRSQRFTEKNGTLPTLITACQPVDNLLVLYFIWYFHIYNPLQYSAASI